MPTVALKPGPEYAGPWLRRDGQIRTRPLDFYTAVWRQCGPFVRIRCARHLVLPDHPSRRGRARPAKEPQELPQVRRAHQADPPADGQRPIQQRGRLVAAAAAPYAARLPPPADRRPQRADGCRRRRPRR